MPLLGQRPHRVALHELDFDRRQTPLGFRDAHSDRRLLADHLAWRAGWRCSAAGQRGGREGGQADDENDDKNRSSLRIDAVE